MTTATLFGNSINLPVTRRPQTQEHSVWERTTDAILAWMIRTSEQSSKARAARAFAALNALSDEELAARGLTRGDLVFRVFGARALI